MVYRSFYTARIRKHVSRAGDSSARLRTMDDSIHHRMCDALARTLPRFDLGVGREYCSSGEDVL